MSKPHRKINRNRNQSRQGFEGWIHKKRALEDEIAAALEADRLASLANPPVKAEPEEPGLSVGDQIKEWNAQVKAGKSKGHQRQD